jgi:hypothetical protein
VEAKPEQSILIGVLMGLRPSHCLLHGKKQASCYSHKGNIQPLLQLFEQGYIEFTVTEG